MKNNQINLHHLKLLCTFVAYFYHEETTMHSFKQKIQAFDTGESGTKDLSGERLLFTPPHANS